MKSWRRIPTIGQDESAQALAEFVIVIPLILFVFFAMLQTLLVAQAAQLTNYAAFAAARSYATSYSKFLADSHDPDQAHNEASQQAQTAALLIMAPVSHAQTGEARELWSSLRRDVESMDYMVRKIYGLAEGFVTAYVYRMKGFSVVVDGDRSSPTSVVKVQFDYLMPISVPGLAEMWNYLNRLAPSQTMDEVFDLGAPGIDPSAFTTVLRSILAALTEAAKIENTLGSHFSESLKTIIEKALDRVYAVGFLGARHNVTLHAKSICGFEPWSGIVRDADTASRCEGEEDENAKRCRNTIKDIDPLIEDEKIKCKQAQTQSEQYAIALEELELARDDYNDCLDEAEEPEDCAAEREAYLDARKKEVEARKKAEIANAACKEAGEKVKAQQEAVEKACQSPQGSL